MMNDQQATDYVIRALGRFVERNQIITEVCERTGKSWAYAEAFVQEVEREHARRIQKRRVPMIMGMAVGLTVAGVVVTLGVIVLTLNGWTSSLWGVPYLGNLSVFIGGMATLAGGIIGLSQAQKELKQPREESDAIDGGLYL
jgi:hypothetical protein